MCNVSMNLANVSMNLAISNQINKTVLLQDQSKLTDCKISVANMMVL